MKILILLLIISTSSLYAQDPEHSYKMRVSWVKSVKKLMVKIEKKKPLKLTAYEKSFLEKFNLIEAAWAESDSRYNCFHAGWPSVKKNGTCENPATSNPDYKKSACKSNELQCQPLLFGDGLCAPAANSRERNEAFSKCESKFQSEKNGNMDFLKELTPEEVQDLQELSMVAGDVCKEDSSAECKEINRKIQDGLKSIDDAFKVSAKMLMKNELSLMVSKAPTPKPQATETHTEDCPTDSHTHGIEKAVANIQAVATSGVDEVYDAIKSEFLNSPFCDPHSVISDPNEKPSPVITAALLRDMSFISFMHTTTKHPSENLQKLKDKYSLRQESIDEVMPLLNEVHSLKTDTDHTRTLKARARALIVQDFLKNYRHDPDYMKDMVKDELVKKNIFTKNESGEVECPFVTKDAFLKALAGREEVLKRHGGSLKNKKQLTIVDYTRPSNERRMFVIDLETNKVLHNTWVAHGGGGGSQAEGADGLGSSPVMSNTSGSNLSSDGFVIATQASHGKLFGPNVILSGIDENNGNMQKRAVILHKWSSPYTGYSAGVQDYDGETDSFGPVYDITNHMKTTNFKAASKDEIETSLRAISDSVYASDLMSATQGCLGVPLNNIKHLDKKGRDLDQVEALRQDLPGSLMFNYSGPEMSSKFF